MLTTTASTCLQHSRNHVRRLFLSSVATAQTNFTKPGAQNKGDLCTLDAMLLRTHPLKSVFPLCTKECLQTIHQEAGGHWQKVVSRSEMGVNKRRKEVTKKAKVDERKRERGNRITGDINLFLHCQRNQESNQDILHNSGQSSVKLVDKGVMTVQKGPTVHLQPPHSNCAFM